MPNKMTRYKGSSKNKLNDFPDILKEPILIPERPRPSLAYSAKEWEGVLKEYNTKVLESVSSAKRQKFSTLMEYYGINHQVPIDQWLIFAFKLAEDFIPGFEVKTKKKMGRSPEWCIYKLALLYLCIQKKIQEKNHSVKAICSYLVKEEPWKSMGKYQGIRPKTLENAYAKSEESFLIKFIKLQLDGAPLTLEEIDARISLLKGHPNLKLSQ